MKKTSLAVIAIFLMVIGHTVFAQMTQVEFKQAWQGFNGPSLPNAYFFGDRRAIDVSWVSLSLPKKEYEKLVSAVNFEHQGIVAMAAGERVSSSGFVKIVRLQQFARGDDPPMDVAMHVGIRDATCAKKGSTSYPFAVAVFEKPKIFRPFGGFSVDNFNDGCGEEMIGKPTETARR